MQGFILNTNRVRDEDLIVSILTENSLKTLYRFYGARHSIVHIGHKIDFEEESSGASIARLRNVTHLGFKFLHNLEKLKVWQQFLRLMYQHLKDVEVVEQFYFHLLDELARKIEKQNPKRGCAESYVKMLEFEGRIHTLDRCYFCREELDKNLIALTRAFLPSHSRCSYSKNFENRKIKTLFENKNSLFIEDMEIDMLWDIILEGF